MGFFSNFLSTSFDDWLTGKASAQAQYDVQKQAAVELPSLQKEGYRRAGINPIYMAGHGFQPAQISANPGSGYSEISKGLGAVGAGTAGIIGAVTSAYKAKKEGELIDEQKKYLESQKTGQDIKNIQHGTGVRDVTEGYVNPVVDTARAVVNPVATAYGASKVASAVKSVVGDKSLSPAAKSRTINLLRSASRSGSAAFGLSTSSPYILPLILSGLGIKETISPSNEGSKKTMDLHYAPSPWSRIRLR